MRSVTKGLSRRSGGGTPLAEHCSTRFQSTLSRGHLLDTPITMNPKDTEISLGSNQCNEFTDL